MYMYMKHSPLCLQVLESISGLRESKHEPVCVVNGYLNRQDACCIIQEKWGSLCQIIDLLLTKVFQSR